MEKDLFNYLLSKQTHKDEDLESRFKDFKNYFSDFFRSFSSRNIYELCEVSDKDIVVSALVACNPFNTKEVLNLVSKYPLLFSDNFIINVGILTLYFNDEGFKKELDKCLKFNINKLNRVSKIKVLFGKLGLPSFSSINFDNFLCMYPDSLNDLGIIFKNFKDIDNNVCSFLLSAKDKFNQEINDEDNKEFLKNLNSEERKAFLKKFLPNKENSKFLLESASVYLDNINEKYNKFIKDYEQKEKERRRVNKNILDLVKELNTSLEIKNIDAIIRLCPDDESKNLVVDFVISHNKEIYLELSHEYEKAKFNSDENLSFLFNKYGFSYDILSSSEKESLKEMVNDDIESMLIRLYNLSLDSVNVSKVCLNKLKSIEDLVQKHFITKEWLRDNVNLLYEDDNILNLVISNLNLLSNQGINMILYSNSLDVLKSNLLSKNLDVLSIYGLSINKNISNINFLDSSDLCRKLDFIISSRIQFNDSLDVLNYSFLDLFRLKISIMLNIPMEMVDINDSDLFNDFSNYLIPDEKIEKLKRDYTGVSDLPMFLDSFRLNSVVLDINGVLVSSEKVKRNINNLGSCDKLDCFYSIIYNGYYSLDELESLSLSILENENVNSLVKKSS